MLKGGLHTNPPLCMPLTHVDYILSTKLSSRILFSSASHAHSITQEGLWWTESNCSAVSIITRVAN